MKYQLLRTFLFIGINLSFLVACNSNGTGYGKKGIHIVVENMTSEHIDSIEVYVQNDKQRAVKLNLRPYAKQKFYLNMMITGSGDGNWRIDYQFRKEKTGKSAAFGYYTSGHIEEDWFELKIDSAGVKAIGH